MPTGGSRRGTVSSQDQLSDRHTRSTQSQMSEGAQNVARSTASSRSDSTTPYSQNSSGSQPKQDQELAQDQRRRRQPLSEAVNDAFDQSDVASKVDPDLVAAITSQVIQNLKLSGLGVDHNSPPTAPAVVAQPVPKSPSASNTIPPRDVYTPPSPVRDEPYSLNSLGADSLPPPFRSSFDIPLDGHNDDRFPMRSAAEPVSAFKDHARFRPTAPQRQSTGDATTLEKIWRPLFSADGKPTARLGQFLRGLALHIIEDYEPTFSLVITPGKMAKFYNEVRLPNEIYPWAAIFGGKVTNSSLSHLYRDLKCQHHFVQAGNDDKPTIPGLTPAGFECWMTHVIRAHPDLEFDRFAKAVLDMPISNSDDRRERFPKQLSRRLFPAYADGTIREHLEDSILADPVIDLLRTATPITSISTKQPSAKPVPDSAPVPHIPPSQSFSHLPEQREQPWLHDQNQRMTPPPMDESDRAESPPAVALERERKPYYAQPGGGKIPTEQPKSDSVPQRSNTTSSTRRTHNDRADDGHPHARFRSDSTTAAPTLHRRHSPTKSDYSIRSSAAEPSSHSHRASIYESDDDSHRLDRQQSREQRARQHIVESTQHRGSDEDGNRARGGSTNNAPTYYPPPPPSRYG